MFLLFCVFLVQLESKSDDEDQRPQKDVSELSSEQIDNLLQVSELLPIIWVYQKTPHFIPDLIPENYIDIRPLRSKITVRNKRSLGL